MSWQLAKSDNENRLFSFNILLFFFAGTSHLLLLLKMENSLSEYELLRLRNIKRNHEFLKSLGKFAFFIVNFFVLS